MTTLSPGQIMLAVALVFGIATACQVIAPKLHVPGLILLLPAGFLLGLFAPQLQMDDVLGPAFPVIVDLIVAVILFQGGMQLGAIKLDRADRSVVRRLVWIGGAITCAAATLAAHFVVGMSWPLAFMLGAILIVSGPTVVTPILDFARPKQQVRGILMWESTLLDPLGAIVAVVVFQLVRVSSMYAPVEAVATFLWSMLVASVAGLCGVLLAVLGSRLSRGNRMLGTQVLIGSVILTAGVASFVAPSSGLLAALLMGVAMRPLAKRLNTSIDSIVPFFDTIASIGVGVLFVSIAALVPSPIFATAVLPAIGVALLLVLVVRPLVITVCTARTSLARRDRVFMAWMDPRGIVAAATASSIGASLVAANVPGAENLLPAAFVIIAVTVFIYGLTAVPVVRALGIRDSTEVPS